MLTDTFSKPIKDYRLWCMALALSLVLYAQLKPSEIRPVPVYNLIAIVDITRSMNAEDYELEGKPVSRLAYVKHSLRELLLQLPCQSKLGLGIFTDRRSTVLLDPIEVCSGFNELDKAITALDWRMAWAADSRIANGLLSTLEMLQKRDEAILFLTDGHEAPPVNPAYRTDFAAVKGKLNGLIMGVGGDKAVTIPKYNNRNERIGVYQQEDVPHRSTFGISDLNPEHIEGYNARNAPFGNYEITGSEHLTALKESYLSQLSLESGFEYRRLTAQNTIFAQLEASKINSMIINSAVDLRWHWISLALIFLLILWI